MSIPLVMVGPGEGYVTRLETQGLELLKRVGQPAGTAQDWDTQSNGSLAGYSRRPKRGGKGLSGQGDTAAAAGVGAAARADEFCHSDPAQSLPAVTLAAERWIKCGTLMAAANAIEAWLLNQQRALVSASASLQALVGAGDSVRAPGEARSAQPPTGGGATVWRLGADSALVAPVSGAALMVGAVAGQKIEVKEIVDEPDAQTTYDPHDDPRLAVEARLFPHDAGDGRRIVRQQGYRLRARRSVDQEGGAGARSEQGTLFGAYV